MITLLISILLFIVFLFLSAIHFYWGLGGSWGSEASIPTNEKGEKVMNPKVVECFVVGLSLLSMGLLILAKSELLIFNLPDWLLKYGLWAIAFIFLLRALGEFQYIGIFKKVKHTRFGKMDTKFYSPLCLTIAILILILELKK